MMADVPVHPSLSVLLVLLPFVWFFWRSLAERFAAERAVANALTPGLAVFANVFCTHVIGSITGSFTAGLSFAIAGPGALGLFVWLRRRASGRAASDDRPALDLRYAGALLFALLAMLPTVVLFDYHELSVSFGHMSTAAQIMNDIYPPRNISAADEPWIYHYGVDQLFASAAALLRIRLDAAIDLVALALWLYTAHLFGLLCRLLFGRPYDSLGVLVGCFFGGLPWLASLDWPSSRAELQGVYMYFGYWGNPPLVSNFLQYPWALGVPLILFSLLVLAVDLARPGTDGAARWPAPAMIGLALLTSMVSQTVVFLTLLVALGLWGVLLAVRDLPRHRHLIVGLGAAILLAAALVPLLGGMLGPPARSFLHGILAWAGLLDAPANTYAGHLGFWRPSPLLEKLRWNVASFGLLPIGLFGLFTRQRPTTRRLMELMAILFAVSFLAMNLFFYEKTWDIVKFAVAGSVPLAILCVGTAKVMIGRASSVTSRWRRSLVKGGVAAWIALLLAAGVLYQASLIAEAVHELKPRSRQQALWRKPRELGSLAAVDAAAIAWLRRHIRPGEMVVCSRQLQRFCAILGGFPQAWIRLPGSLSLVTDPQWHERLLWQAHTPEQFAASGVCWAIDFPRSDVAWMASRVKYVGMEPPGDTRCSVAPSGKQKPCRRVKVIYLCPESPPAPHEPPA